MRPPPLQLSAVGDRSLMWVCHSTGTPGCSTALCSVPLDCTQARFFKRTAEVTICTISERLPDRPRQLPLHSLTAEAEGGNLCCSRATAVPSIPNRRHPDKVGEWPANHAHSSLPGCRGHLANHRAREGGKRKRFRSLSLCVGTWCVQ